MAIEQKLRGLQLLQLLIRGSQKQRVYRPCSCLQGIQHLELVYIRSVILWPDKWFIPKLPFLDLESIEYGHTVCQNAPGIQQHQSVKDYGRPNRKLLQE